MSIEIDIKDCSGDSMGCLMARGHFGPVEFLKACADYWGEPLDDGWDEPKHGWWRAVPDRSGEYRSTFHDAEPNTRGAFPVTYTTNW